MNVIVRSLSEQLVDIMRERVLAGQFDPKAAIRQDAVATEFGISKIPLREALTRLEQEGLLISQPNRGFFVRALDVRELEEIYALRLKLEPDAVVLGAQRATDADREAAVTALEIFKTKAESSSVSGGAHNRALHLALIRAGGERLTFGILQRLHILADRYVCKHLEPLGRDERADKEHDDLLEAWLQRDAKAIRSLTKSHILATLTDLRHQIG